MTPAASWLVFLVTREATSPGALSSLALVKLTTTDQIKFNDKSHTGVTCAPLGYVFLYGASGPWTVSIGDASCLLGHFSFPVIIGKYTKDQQVTQTLFLGSR